MDLTSERGLRLRVQRFVLFLKAIFDDKLFEG